MKLDRSTIEAYSKDFTRALFIVLVGSSILTALIYFWPVKPVSFSDVSLLLLVMLTGIGCLALIYEKNWDWGDIKKRIMKKGIGVGFVQNL